MKTTFRSFYAARMALTRRFVPFISTAHADDLNIKTDPGVPRRSMRILHPDRLQLRQSSGGTNADEILTRLVRRGDDDQLRHRTGNEKRVNLKKPTVTVGTTPRQSYNRYLKAPSLMFLAGNAGTGLPQLIRGINRNPAMTPVWRCS